MSLDDDMEMIEMMVVEATEHLDSLDSLLIDWEQDPDAATPDEINCAFRNLHTIKGGFAFFGLNAIKELAHVMEQMLDEIREGKLALNNDLVGRLADGAGLLRNMVEDVWNSNDVDISFMCARLTGDDESESVGKTSVVTTAGQIEPTPEDWERIKRNSWNAMLINIRSRADLDAKDRTVIDISGKLSAFGEILDVVTDFSFITDLDNCLDNEHFIRVLYATMAPPEMVIEELDMPAEQVDILQPESSAPILAEAVDVSQESASSAAAEPVAPEESPSAPSAVAVGATNGESARRNE